MSRIARTMSALNDKQRKALVPYIVAGDPSPSVTLSFLHSLVDEGADIIELGVPFSDPMAEGPVIQLAHERSLLNNTSLRSTLGLVKKFREENDSTPIVLMGYTNPIEAMGYAEFAAAAQEAGIDGVLTVDLPPEESVDFNAILQRHEIDNIFLIAPTTTEERIEKICAMASGYIYYVSLKGVTGAGSLDIASVEQRVGIIRRYAETPICVGFGIKDSESARSIACCADGVVVGSVLVDLMGQGDAGLLKARSLFAEIRQGVDGYTK